MLRAFCFFLAGVVSVLWWGCASMMLTLLLYILLPASIRKSYLKQGDVSPVHFMTLLPSFPTGLLLGIWLEKWQTGLGRLKVGLPGCHWSLAVTILIAMAIHPHWVVPAIPAHLHRAHHQELVHLRGLDGKWFLFQSSKPWVGSLWVQRVLVRFPIVSKGFILPISSVCPFFLLWHIQLSGVVNLRTGDLRPHVILSAMQRLHVSGWGQRMASRAGSLAKFLQFHLIFTVTVSGECSLLHTHGWLSVLSQDVACRLLLLVPARHYRLLGWAEGPTISDVRLFLAYI